MSHRSFDYWTCYVKLAASQSSYQLIIGKSRQLLPRSRLVLPFWYRLTQVVLEKRPLNGCSDSSIVTARILCPSLCPSKPAAVGLLLWARRAGNIDRLLQQRRANAGSATLSAYIGSWTQTCFDIYTVRRKKGTNFLLWASLLTLDRNWWIFFAYIKERIYGYFYLP